MLETVTIVNSSWRSHALCTCVAVKHFTRLPEKSSIRRVGRRRSSSEPSMNLNGYHYSKDVARWVPPSAGYITASPIHNKIVPTGTCTRGCNLIRIKSKGIVHHTDGRRREDGETSYYKSLGLRLAGMTVKTDKTLSKVIDNKIN